MACSPAKQPLLTSCSVAFVILIARSCRFRDSGRSFLCSWRKSSALEVESPGTGHKLVNIYCVRIIKIKLTLSNITDSSFKHYLGGLCWLAYLFVRIQCLLVLVDLWRASPMLDIALVVFFYSASSFPNKVSSRANRPAIVLLVISLKYQNKILFTLVW